MLDSFESLTGIKKKHNKTYPDGFTLERQIRFFNHMFINVYNPQDNGKSQWFFINGTYTRTLETEDGKRSIEIKKYDRVRNLQESLYKAILNYDVNTERLINFSVDSLRIMGNNSYELNVKGGFKEKQPYHIVQLIRSGDVFDKPVCYMGDQGFGAIPDLFTDYRMYIDGLKKNLDINYFDMILENNPFGIKSLRTVDPPKLVSKMFKRIL